MEKYKWVGLLIISCVICFCYTPPSQGTIVAISTFDSDVDGWTWRSENNERYSWQADGGNPGGYIHFDNNPSGYTYTNIFAPQKFLGDWSLLNNTGAILYDVNIFSTGLYTDRNGYRCTLSGPGGRAQWTGEYPDPQVGWATVYVPIQESLWEMLSGTWAGLLNNIDLFSIQTAYYTNYTTFEITGTDNIMLVPEPLTVLVLTIGCLFLKKRR